MKLRFPTILSDFIFNVVLSFFFFTFSLNSILVCTDSSSFTFISNWTKIELWCVVLLQHPGRGEAGSVWPPSSPRGAQPGRWGDAGCRCRSPGALQSNPLDIRYFCTLRRRQRLAWHARGFTCHCEFPTDTCMHSNNILN